MLATPTCTQKSLHFLHINGLPLSLCWGWWEGVVSLLGCVCGCCRSVGGGGGLFGWLYEKTKNLCDGGSLPGTSGTILVCFFIFAKFFGQVFYFFIDQVFVSNSCFVAQSFDFAISRCDANLVRGNCLLERINTLQANWILLLKDHHVCGLSLQLEMLTFIKVFFQIQLILRLNYFFNQFHFCVVFFQLGLSSFSVVSEFKNDF